MKRASAMLTLDVPAQVGIHGLRRPPERRWVPAFAGMTRCVGDDA